MPSFEYFGFTWQQLVERIAKFHACISAPLALATVSDWVRRWRPCALRFGSKQFFNLPGA